MVKATGSVRQRITNSAEKIFAEKGYSATTTREIVKDAGTSLSAIQTYFQSKENIYREVLQQAVATFYEVNRPILQEIDTLLDKGFRDSNAVWDYIVLLISGSLEWIFSERNGRRMVLVNNELLHPSDVCPDIQEPIVRSFHYFEKLFLAYTGSSERVWARQLSFFVLTSMFDIHNYPQFLGNVLGADISEQRVQTETKLQLKEYLFITLRYYLDIKKQ